MNNNKNGKGYTWNNNARLHHSQILIMWHLRTKIGLHLRHKHHFKVTCWNRRKLALNCTLLQSNIGITKKQRILVSFGTFLKTYIKFLKIVLRWNQCLNLIFYKLPRQLQHHTEHSHWFGKNNILLRCFPPKRTVVNFGDEIKPQLSHLFDLYILHISKY